MFLAPITVGAELNKQLPAEHDNHFIAPISINIHSQQLASALNQLGKEANLNIAFPTDLVLGKIAPQIKGTMSRKEALQRLLANSGLVANIDGNTVYIQRAPQNTSVNEYKLDKMLIRAKRSYEIGPLPGLGLTKEEIPGNVQSITAKEIKESHSLSITDLLNKKLQSVNVNDYQGNPFMMDVTYRGFTASPQIGTPQGLSVFLDGIRVNEPFGDVVNWDMIPMNALAGVDVFPGSNPIFGLGTLGGAFALKTKDGFNNEGVDAEVLTGSFGRKQLQVSAGTNNGTFALFGAGNFFLEDGWRDNSPSRVNQMFGKASYRGEKLDLNLSTLIVTNDLVGNGLLPSEEYARNQTSVFTSPDTTKNKLLQFQLSGAFQANDNFSVTGQVYRRNSKRHSEGADVYTDYPVGEESYRNLEGDDQVTCLYSSNNKYSLPDYYLVEIPVANGQQLADWGAYSNALSNVVNTDPSDPAYSGYVADPAYQTYLNNNQVKFIVDHINGAPPDLSLIQDTLNQDLPDDFAQWAQYNFKIYQNYFAYAFYSPQLIHVDQISGPSLPGSISKWAYANYFTIGAPHSPNQVDFSDGLQNYFYTENKDANGNGNGTYNQHLIFTKRAQNADACNLARTKLDPSGALTYRGSQHGGYIDQDPATGAIRFIDGASDGSGGTVKGIPTAVMTTNDINQMVNGGSIQLNWNFEHHKFMLGASIDSSSASYGSGQRLGFFDAHRKGYLDPAQALDVFAAADEEVRNNDFDGTSLTKSIYASETWSPIDTLHVTGAARYNDTNIKNTIATRSAGFAVLNLHSFRAVPDVFNICRPGDPCITGHKIPDLANLLNPPETEKFSYYSFNPSLGATWQVTSNLNIFGNMAQGVRTPSVIELGCALDKTLVLTSPARDADGDGVIDEPARYSYKSAAENRSCSLPSALSGDPHLPQIKATTFDIGMRGTYANALGMENIEWNIGAYRTNLKDDIYLITLADGRNFFDTIGKTRRQGIEAGFGGSFGKANFKLNYALTDATFEDNFEMISNDNSSTFYSLADDDVVGLIKVKPGNRMPGVPLHNLNASFSYDVTPKWNIGLTVVAHSESFVRGNENNEHQTGVSREIWVSPSGVQVPVNTPGALLVGKTQPTTNPGTVAGYATF